MARNKDFFVNSTPKRDRSFFVKEEKTTSNVVKANTYPIKDKYNSAFAMPVKQGIGDKVANFFKMTLPTAAEKAVDNIKEPFTGASASKLMTEAKLSPQMMVEDAKIQMAKENPTREDYAMVKQTQEVINKYGKPESNFRAISEDTTKLQEQLKSAEKTWQVSPVDATLANTGAGVANIFGSLGSFANSLGADKVPLLKDVTNFAVDGARKAQENAQQYNRGNYGEALGTVTQGVVNLVPYFVLGTGKTAVKGATAVTKYAKYIEPIIKNPSFWYSLTSMWGSKYQEKLDEGYNRFQALGNSILYAVPAALIEVSGGIGAKGKETQSLLRTMGEEIGEEIAQDIMGGISDKIATNHDLPVFSTTEDAIINPKELGKTALYTAPIVAIGGGANRVINNIANPNSQTEALPEMDVSTQNQLANITKNIEYQKQNENLANNQIEQIIKEARNNIENSKNVLALPESGKFYADEKGNVVTAQNYVAPRRQAQNQNSPVNTKQTIIDVQNNSQNDLLRQINTTLPTQAEMAQKANTEQINATPNLPTQKAQKTYQSAKIAGMTDVDMKKAIDLNNMLRSGANLQFYDEKNIPQNVQADKAKIANGFYRDGTLWINKNSKNKVEQILGHELTHHLETTNSYTELSNTILDSDVFYDYISEKGYTNVAEYKTKLKEMGYTDAQMNNEMVARFVEEKLFTDQNSIDRLARQNTKLVEKIKNWISDLVVSFKGTAQEKELRRIENMYRKALEQARNTTNTQNIAYSIKENANGKFVKVDTDQDIFEGINEKDYNKIAKMYMQDYLKGTTKLTSNDEAIIDTRGIRKYTNPQQRTSYFDEKMFLTPELKNVLEIAEKVEVSEANKDNSKYNNWEYYKFNFEIGNRTFEGLINIGIDKDGYKHFYEINKIHPIGISSVSTNSTNRMYSNNSINQNDKTVNTQYAQENKNDTAGKEPAFSMPEIPKGHTRLYRGLMDEYDKNYDRRKLDNINGYESWTDSYDLAKAYGDNVYYIDIPTNEIKKEIIDENPKSETYGDRNLIYFNDKPVGIKGKSGKEYMLYTDHDNYPDIEYKKVEETDKVSFSMPQTDNQGRTLSKEQQEFFKDSKVRDENGKLLEVYHGTEANVGIPKEYWFNTFDIDRTGANGSVLGDGFYFTDNLEHAQRYAHSKGNVYTTYLNITNPFEKSRTQTFKEAVEEINPDFDISRLFLPNSSRFDGKRLREYLIENGYDGVFLEGTYVAFEPNQIKNVDNTNPTENPDIRYSVNPVNIAKNPPNIETGLDQLNRAKRVKEGDSQSNFAGNILNQSIFDEKFTNLALDDKNIRSYESISNKETLQEANDAINEQGQKWVDRFLDKPNGEMKATDIAGGIILMNRYQQVGDYESMIRIAEKLRKAGTQQGQTIQMFSVLGRMTPEGMTYYAQKELSKAYDEILKNKTQKWADEHADEFKLNEKDIEYIQRRVNQAAKLPEGRDKYILLAEIAERIQNKIPPQPGQGLKALARNSMLLNPKTVVRNILGNVVIAPNHIVSDFIGSKIDESISKKTGIRTTGGFDAKALQGAKKGFYESFDDFRRKISTREMGGDRFEIGQGKNFYENHTGKFAETRNKINKALNGLDRVTGFLLEAGDRPFYETWFINSLNNQMKLNNVTEPTAEMIEIATDEALQRTWQDNNSYTRVVKSVRDGLNKLNVKGYGLGDMVMPFVKTPANLTKAVVDFSPLGAINAAVKTSQFNKDIGKGTATAKQQREVVKAWSQVITGSLGMAILTALANAGILSGGSDEDKDVRSFEQNILGIKPYSIKIGDKTYTYDWAQPLGTSAAMVADTVKSLKNAKDTEGKVAAILEGAQSGASVLLEQSFVSGIRNLFEEDNLINALIETGFNEASKFTPQFLSQLAQIQDDTARTSYVYNNIPQTAINKVKAKIPGLRETLEPSVDVLGREVKTDNSVGNVMFNPANTAFTRTTEGAEEMYRVYKATGEKSAIAQVAPYYFNVGSEKIVLTPKQRTQYQKTTGKIASDGVERLIDNKAYKNLSDADKAEILAELYSYGNAIAKEEASNQYLMPKDMQKIKDSGMNPEEYILLKRIANSGGTKKEELYNSLTSAGYSKKQTESFLSYYKGYKLDDTINNTLPPLKQQRAKLPPLKK